jgi:hypothetical protein
LYQKGPLLIHITRTSFKDGKVYGHTRLRMAHGVESLDTLGRHPPPSDLTLQRPKDNRPNLSTTPCATRDAYPWALAVLPGLAAPARELSELPILSR